MIYFSQVGRFLRSAKFPDNIKKQLLLILLLPFATFSWATTYTSIADNDWDANGIPPNPLPDGDVINLNHVFLYSWANTVLLKDGSTLNINSGGALTAQHLTIETTATLNVNFGGSITTPGHILNESNNVLIDGTITESGNFTNNGHISGSGTLNMGDGSSIGGDGSINGTSMDNINYSAGDDLDLSQPLPVTLVYFIGSIKNKRVELTWSTSSEINNNYFTIERSTAENWVVIAEIDGAGHSSDIKTYQYIDRQPFQGKSFYRLKQTDFDGQFEYFEPILVTLISTSAIQVNRELKEIKGWPNTPWYLYDLKGNLKLNGETDAFGLSEFSEDLSPGLYVFRMADFTSKICWK